MYMKGLLLVQVTKTYYQIGTYTKIPFFNSLGLTQALYQKSLLIME